MGGQEVQVMETTKVKVRSKLEKREENGGGGRAAEAYQMWGNWLKINRD